MHQDPASKSWGPTQQPIVVCALIGGLCFAVGCQQQVSSQLLGRWVGQPDTAAARAARDQQKYGSSGVADPAAQQFVRERPPTDWEQYATEIRLHFINKNTVEMSLADGSQPISGTWEVLGTSPVGCTIQVSTPRSSGSEQSPAENSSQLRRFEVELNEQDGECVGFLLYEAGADRQLGAVYFRRPD